MPDRTASRAALLALRRDRRIVEEGHRFLDERRIALAHELLRRSRSYAAHRVAFLRRHEQARATFAQAVGRHGLEGLQACPPWRLEPATFERQQVPFLGVTLVASAALPLRATADPAAEWATSEAAACAAAFQALAQDAAALAGEVASLLRLMSEYQRTERRVRAIENIVLPEVRADERRFEAVLEELDQEEILRSRRFARAPLARAGES